MIESEGVGRQLVVRSLRRRKEERERERERKRETEAWHSHRFMID